MLKQNKKTAELEKRELYFFYITSVMYWGDIVNRFFLPSVFCLSFALMTLSCIVAKTSGDAFLEIKTLRLNGRSIEPNHEVEIKDLDKIDINDIKATFAYNDIEGEVELPIVLMNAPILLRKGVPVRVEFYVPAKKDEYQSWQGCFNAILK